MIFIDTQLAADGVVSEHNLFKLCVIRIFVFLLPVYRV